MKTPEHPGWALLRLIVLMLTLTTVLWLNANQFDATEIKSIVTMFIAAAGVEGGIQAIRKMGGK